MRILIPLILLAACGTGGEAAQGNAAPAARAARPFTVRQITMFDEPWAMAFLPGPGPRALVTERKGKLKLLWSDVGRVGDVAGAPAVDYGGQGGFGDVVLHPRFAQNRLVYLSWVEAGEGGNRGAVVGRARFLEDGNRPRLEGLQIIYRQSPKLSGRGHFGHRIAFGPDGKLYISNGERQEFTPAQDMNANLGKIVRLNDDGTVPADNPFARRGGVTAQIWSLGHRNPLGLAFDGSGRLWEIEMGPKGGDELNLVERGRNYGYPIVSNGDHYDGKDIPDHPTRPEFAAPRVWWTPVISPGDMIVYSGSAFPSWRGDILVAGLSSKALIRVDVNGANAREAERWDMGKRIRVVEQGPGGSVYLLEDGEGGRLLKLIPSK
ncbi:MAG TPA: PQQ-dependent sugar dehydrogenase [Allosphingosinicella sp.]|jgi:glucose/arabinose dehydrogenase|nr:PQQ-dependent sugar dehydrogenase [Allosphingosinicella sp.]